MFGFTFGIISVEEKAHVWTVHRSYKKWGLPCGESQFTTTCSFDLRATWTPEVLTIRCQALLWRACKSVYHTPPPPAPHAQSHTSCSGEERLHWPSCRELEEGGTCPEEWAQTLSSWRSWRPGRHLWGSPWMDFILQRGVLSMHLRVGAGNVHSSFAIVFIPFAD